ncbi:unnamed protein product [Prunus armeniaca]|uniref:Uncharacterized protein n=1 Tax=Prunus armeniaca TaxID=36596 RepID=A0A6J5XVB7_PRUAR|nr:unnamed protein product [Prunus armeniaca]
MASSLATTSAAATTSTNLAHYKTNNNTYKHNCLSNVSFRLSPKPKLRFFSKLRFVFRENAGTKD